MSDSSLARAAGDAGTTLVEILMAVALIGIGFVALLSGFGTVIVGSDMHHKQADAETVAATAAEQLRSTTIVHQPCATAATYESAIRTAIAPELSSIGWPSSVLTIESVRYWGGPTLGYGTTCYDDDAHEHLLQTQLVRLVVTAPGGRALESIDVIKDVKS